MKICVTGGSGMVGSCIKDIVSQYPNCEFTFLHRRTGEHSVELTDNNAVMNYFSNHKYDYIIHLAANVGGLYKNMEKNVEMFNDNIKINMNILEAAHKNNINRGIFCLSSCIYPENPSKFPMDETMIHESPPHPSNEGYAYAKRMLELQCRHYNKAYNREYICVVPVNLYGPHDNFSLTNGHFIPMIMNRLHKTVEWRHAHPTGDIVAYGTGKPLRQFLYAPDFAKIICDVLIGEQYNSTDPIICCNDDEYTIKDIVEKIAKLLDIEKSEIFWDTTKSDGCYKKTVSNAKFKKYFPNFEFVDIDKGLLITYKWFKDNYKTIRQ